MIVIISLITTIIIVSLVWWCIHVFRFIAITAVVKAFLSHEGARVTIAIVVVVAITINLKENKY